MCCINKIIFYCIVNLLAATSQPTTLHHVPVHHMYRRWRLNMFLKVEAPFFFKSSLTDRVTSVSVFESRAQWCKLHACLSRPVTLRSSNSQTSLSQPVYFSSPIMHVNCLLCYLIPHDQINCRILAKKVAFNPCKLAALQQHIQS